MSMTKQKLLEAIEELPDSVVFEIDFNSQCDARHIHNIQEPCEISIDVVSIIDI